MVPRSKDFWLAAFFLSRYSKPIDGKEDKPPEEFGGHTWKLTYQMFYESLGEGRSMITFENSLKNARDVYDGHNENSSRAGWNDENIIKLNKVAKAVFDMYSKVDRVEVWNELKPLVNVDIINYDIVIADLIGIQQSEADKTIISRTEGDKRVVISYRYERNLKLRNATLEIHGYDCVVCGFNFLTTYGEWGKHFAEVHHVEPLSKRGASKVTDPNTDLSVVCANCHRMIHRKKGITLTIEELKSKLEVKSETLS